MLEELREAVLGANLALAKYHLAALTWGNASALDEKTKLVVIKPSGVPYERLAAKDMVVVDLLGNVVEGDLRPSSDTPSHIELYRSFKEIGAIVHAHSPWATTWCQSRRSIPPMGTTHADCFYGDIPCTRELTSAEVESDYELNTARVIVETFRNRDPLDVPGVLVCNHGPFCWGTDVDDAVRNAISLEEIAKLAYHTLRLNPDIHPIHSSLLQRHFRRKHGQSAYYGQVGQPDLRGGES